MRKEIIEFLTPGWEDDPERVERAFKSYPLTRRKTLWEALSDPKTTPIKADKILFQLRYGNDPDYLAIEGAYRFHLGDSHLCEKCLNRYFDLDDTPVRIYNARLAEMLLQSEQERYPWGQHTLRRFDKEGRPISD